MGCSSAIGQTKPEQKIKAIGQHPGIVINLTTRIAAVLNRKVTGSAGYPQPWEY
jgi:hypothetical protein